VQIVDGVSTGVAPIFVEPNGQNRIIVVKGANDLLTPRDVEAAASDLAQAQIIVLQFEIPLETIYHTIRFAKSRGICCILNPAPALTANVAELSAADYFIPNETEAEMMTGLPARTLEEAEACASTLLSQGFRRVLITLGGRGLLLADATGTTAMAACSVSTVDTSGAGDAFIGSLAAFLGEGVPERDAIARANLYAALSTTARGTQKSFLQRRLFETAWELRNS
jgi:ribokinase